jgi:hypothetical protein
MVVNYIPAMARWWSWDWKTCRKNSRSLRCVRDGQRVVLGVLGRWGALILRHHSIYSSINLVEVPSAKVLIQSHCKGSENPR